MKNFEIFVILITFIIQYIKCDVKCNINGYLNCLNSLTFSSAEKQCSENGKCFLTLMDNYDEDCIKKIYNHIHEFKNDFYKNFYVILSTGYPNILCSKEDGEWCFDKYKNVTDNNLLMEEFKNSKCGSVFHNKSNILLNNFGNKNSYYYNSLKMQINNLNTSNGNLKII